MNQVFFSFLNLIIFFLLLKADWPEGYQLAASMNFKFHHAVPTPLSTIISNISENGLKLMIDMMQWNPEKRPSAVNVSFFFIHKNVHHF